MSICFNFPFCGRVKININVEQEYLDSLEIPRQLRQEKRAYLLEKEYDRWYSSFYQKGPL
ncbi:hypothetical protein [Natranaerobius thermophilus]|uniref:Uncharacterized protein n=1 Tax=Natranaerobius thermophilus (strain ATCC BAA-1301 / DSM 18059 / JW/NM-WN-LF) TaxID=457570 RepID=B2A7B8_NATTJ|nr:hypothetical protein [Natranaerobius thermophilus]ACB84312.1 hypothetical protein Nther_0722 [Natranaerobius thermophilus JW/NM-WN-LF]